METNKNLIQRILSLYNKGVHQNNIRLRKRHIYNKLLSVRSFLITAQANKKQKLGSSNYQTLKCVVMKQAPLVECSCVPEFIRNQFSVYKSVEKIPTIINSLSRTLVSDVTTLDGIDRLDVLTYADMKYYKGRKFGLDKPFVFFHEDFLYMINAKYAVLEITAIFDKPLEVLKFNDCGCNLSNSCVPYDNLLFPIEEKLVEALLAYTKQEMLSEFVGQVPQQTQQRKEEEE